MRRNRVVLATAGLVLGAAVLAWDTGAQERPTLLTAAHRGEGPHAHRHRRPGALHHGLPGALGRAVHGTVIVPNGAGGFHEVTFDRGRVDAASDGGRIVLDRPDGPEVSVELTADTKYHGIENAAALVDGRPAMVVSRDGKALHVVQKARRTTADGAKGGRRDGGNNQAPPVVPND